jgi:glycosyltransferase involved in cell wall biosynthesis
MLSGYEKSIRLWLAFRFVVSRTDQLVGLSEIECQYLRRCSGKNVQVTKILNGIPPDLFRPFPKETARTRQPFRILFVGQLIPLKGVEVLFHALNAIAQRIPWQLLLVYQNSGQENHYREMAQKLGIVERVQFIGFLSASELAVLYRNVDVLVLPSYAESLPSVITESLLSGTPVVATRVGGIPEQIESSFGELVPPGDWNELGAALTRVFENLSSYRERAQEMHDFAASRFSIERMVNEHIQLYDAVQARIQPRNFNNSLVYNLVSRFILR